uniref:OSIGBa0111I14.5 protein n=1 Tax=Oryza sativa TaxID=4530 RepID=Q01L61_ORYSA|nr:OSIGBa0111I14.5 [Oryza sativa]
MDISRTNEGYTSCGPSFFELWELSVHANAITLYRKKDGTEAESNEDYGMLFRLSQEGGITYTNLIQQVSVSPNANLAGAEVVGGLPLLQNTYGSFMQLLQAPIESESALYLTSNRFEYDNTFWGFDPHNGYQQNDLQNAQTDTSQMCNSLPQSVAVHPPVASLDMLYDEMQKSSADVDNQAEMCRPTVQLKASSVEVIYNEMQTQTIEADACFDQHFEQATEEDLLSDHAIVTFQQVEEIEQDKSAENPDQNFSEEDINIFLENESVAVVQRGGQDANSAHVPSINKVFADENEAFDLYNGYAYMVGFSTCKASNYHSRKTDVVTRHTFKCNRWRKPSDPKEKDLPEVDEVENCLQTNTTNPLVKKRKQNKVVYTNCKAEMVITLKRGFWYITRLNLEHNHPLSPPEERKFLSRKFYEMFGDIVSFDTTYKTNRYDLPFAPFVGITSHGDNCLFGYAFLQDETSETFQWMFNTFLDCMGGKLPATIITDQDLAMKAAIAIVFPDTVHRNCLFHMLSNARDKTGRTFNSEDEEVYKDFHDIVTKSQTEAEFEYLWKDFIRRNNLYNVRYFQLMWVTRKRWAPVYFKSNWCPLIQTTARSEGTNSRYKADICSSHSVSAFLAQYERIAETIYECFKEQESLTRNTVPDTCYTKYDVTVKVRDSIFEVYKSEIHALQDFRKRKYIVVVDTISEEYECICSRFKKDGILCVHVLKVLIHLNITKLPEKYFIERWRLKDKNQELSVPNTLMSATVLESNPLLRFNILSQKMIKLASDASKTKEKFIYVMNESDKIEDGLKAMSDTAPNEATVHVQDAAATTCGVASVGAQSGILMGPSGVGIDAESTKGAVAETETTDMVGIASTSVLLDPKCSNSKG